MCLKVVTLGLVQSVLFVLFLSSLMKKSLMSSLRHCSIAKWQRINIAVSFLLISNISSGCWSGQVIFRDSNSFVVSKKQFCWINRQKTRSFSQWRSVFHSRLHIHLTIKFQLEERWCAFPACALSVFTFIWSLLHQFEFILQKSGKWNWRENERDDEGRAWSRGEREREREREREAVDVICSHLMRERNTCFHSCQMTVRLCERISSFCSILVISSPASSARPVIVSDWPYLSLTTVATISVGGVERWHFD